MDKKVKEAKLKSKKDNKLQKQVEDLTLDLQRTRADFENYRKRSDLEKDQARDNGKNSVVMQLLPVIDNIDRAVGHMPKELEDNIWAQGVVSVSKSLEKMLGGLNLQKIEANVGDEFNPDMHDAVQFDEESTGDKEVVAEQLLAGYMLNGQPIRHAMVKVKRQ